MNKPTSKSTQDNPLLRLCSPMILIAVTVKTNHHTVEDVLNIWAENSPQEWLASPPLFG